jgi:DNA-binding response OmpR family regulator
MAVPEHLGRPRPEETTPNLREAEPDVVVLLVEDPEVASDALAQTLENSGFAVQRASGARTGAAGASRRSHDLVLLVLGEGSGADIVAELRQRTGLPVIVLSPSAEEADRVAGLEAGADDYVGQSYSRREVAARVAAVLRRTRPRGPRRIRLQDIEIRVPEHEVLVDGRRVELTAREFDVLRYLAERAGQVITRERLLEDVWGMQFPGGTRTVDVHIAQVRRKLGRPGVIRTVRGVGYKALHFPGPVEQTEPEAAAS